MARFKNLGRPRVGLALSGGVARGMAHIGVLKAFAEHGIPVDCVAGSSAGAIVAAALAFGVPMEKLEKEAKSLSWYSIVKFSVSGLGLVSSAEIEKRMEKIIGQVDIRDARVPLAIVATDIEAGEEVVLRKGRAALAVRASSSVPGLFIPTEMDGMKLVDGQVSESLPLSPLASMGADIRIGVDVNKWKSGKKAKNILDVLINSIDILSGYRKEHSAHSADILIEPDVAKYSPSDFRKADAIIAEGYRAAAAKIPEIQKLLTARKNLLGRIFDWFR